MLTLRDFLAGFMLPMALSAAVLVAGWRVARHRLGARESRSAFGPAALALAIVAGWWTLFGRPPLPPIDVTDWLFYLAIVLGVLGSASAAWKWPLQARLGAAAVSAPVAAWLFARPLLRLDPPVVGWFFVAVASALGIAWIASMDHLARKIPGRRFVAILIAAIASASVGLVLTGSQRLMQIGGLLVAAQAGMLLAQLLLGTAGMARGIALVTGVFYGGLLLCGHWYSSLGLWPAIALYLAPATAWIVQPFARRLGSTATAILQILLPAALALSALIPAALQFAERIEQY